MARVSNARSSHVERWVVPAARELLIQEACKDVPTKLLEEVAFIEMGQSPDGNTVNSDGVGTPFIGGPADLGIEFPESSRWTTQPTKLSKHDDIIVCVRATIGEPRWSDGVYCLGRGVAGIRPKDSKIDRKFLFRIIQANERLLFEKGTGTTFKTIGKEHLAGIRVPMLSPETQKMIGNYLEWLESHSKTRPDFSTAPSLPDFLSDMASTVVHIESLTAQINEAQRLRKEADFETDAFIASAQNAAFFGLVKTDRVKSEESAHELLKRTLHKRHAYWEETILAKGKDPNKANYEEPQQITLDDLPTLPENRYWVSWDMVLAFEDGAFRRGPFGSTLRKSIFVESGYKVYEQYCPINDDCSFGRYYITPEMFKKLRSFEVKVGDYLISCSGVTLGRITRVPENSEQGVINQALLRVRINEQIVDPKYFLYCFRAPFFQKMLFANSTGSAIPNLKGVKELKAIPLPLPPLDEQRRIVAYLDGLQAKVNALRELQSASGEELSALMPSILDKAFKGEL